MSRALPTKFGREGPRSDQLSPPSLFTSLPDLKDENEIDVGMSNAEGVPLNGRTLDGNALGKTEAPAYGLSGTCSAPGKSKRGRGIFEGRMGGALVKALGGGSTQGLGAEAGVVDEEDADKEASADEEADVDEEADEYF